MTQQNQSPSNSSSKSNTSSSSKSSSSSKGSGLKTFVKAAGTAIAVATGICHLNDHVNKKK